MRKSSTLLSALLLAIGLVAVAQSPARAADDKVYTLKYHFSYPPTLAFYNKVGTGFIKLVEEWSNGRIKFETYEAGALTSVGGMVEAVDSGIIDVSQSWGGFYVGDVPEADIEVGLPLAWRDQYETYDAYYNRGLKDVIAEAYESRFNVKHFPAIIGLVYGISTREPITGLDDLKGKKIRALGVYGELVQALGASAVVVPGPEIYTAMQLGTIDGLVYGVEALPASGLETFLKTTIISPNFNSGAGHWLINRDTWNSLPKDLQQVIERVVQYGNAANGMQYRVVEAGATGVLKKAGVNLLSLSPEDEKKVSAVAQTLWDKIAARSELAAKGVAIVRQQQRDFGHLD